MSDSRCKGRIRLSTFVLPVGVLMASAGLAQEYVNLEDTTVEGQVMFGGIDPWYSNDGKTCEIRARLNSITATGGSGSGDFPLEVAQRYGGCRYMEVRILTDGIQFDNHRGDVWDVDLTAIGGTLDATQWHVYRIMQTVDQAENQDGRYWNFIIDGVFCDTNDRGYGGALTGSHEEIRWGTGRAMEELIHWDIDYIYLADEEFSATVITESANWDYKYDAGKHPTDFDSVEIGPDGGGGTTSWVVQQGTEGLGVALTTVSGSPTATPTDTSTPTDTPIPVTLSFGPGSPIAVPPGSTGNTLYVNLENPTNVLALYFTITDVPDNLTFTAATSTSRTSSHIIPFEDKGGETTLIVLSLQADLIAPGSGPVVELTFDMNTEAPASEQQSITDIAFTAVQVAAEDKSELPAILVPNQVVEGGVVCTPGDMEPDGDWDLFDILRIVDIALDIPPPPTEYELCAGDLDEDGDIDLFDILTLVDIILEA